MDDNFPTNAYKKREPLGVERVERPKIERIVDGPVLRRKRPLSRRIKETFLGGEGATGVFQFVFMEVIVPAAKDMIADSATQAIERTVFGESRSTSRRTGSRIAASVGQVAYNRFGGNSVLTNREAPRQSMSTRGRAVRDFDEILLATRQEGEEVLEKMYTLLSQFGSVSVSDLEEMLGIKGEYTNQKYGWEDLTGSRLVRIRNGSYLLDLPPSQVLR